MFLSRRSQGVRHGCQMAEDGFRVWHRDLGWVNGVVRAV
jgi:hypothetical protein